MNSLTNANPPAADDRRLVEDLRGYVGVIRRGWRFLAVSVLACLTVAIVYVARTHSVYHGSARLLVLQQGGGAAARDDGERAGAVPVR